ncbi:hypothetical protein SAMN04490197_4064 [Pseudomonas orientalis]|uniref:Uncharacterized protein n=1 Tax=Pseudomonas orientalis TaxID=76758 RepID=A0A8B3Y1E9_9PSED|nr:hypothetical protein SAMN04490197_4064 [Pseudomonas orientalis]
MVFLVSSSVFAALSERIRATFNASKSDFRWFSLSLPSELIKQPLVNAFLTISYEQKRPSNP